jgi:hypothetical protein
VRVAAGALDALLQDGRTLVDPGPEERTALDRLAALGVVRFAEQPVFRCFDPRDDRCADHPTRACSAWVLAAADPDERATCPACGLDHERRAPSARQVEVRLVADRLVGFVEDALREIDPDARRRREGVAWSVSTPDADAVVVWLDGSLDTRLVTRAFATGQPVVYLAARSSAWAGRFRDDPWLAPIGIAQVLADGSSALREAIRARAEAPLGVAEPALRPWSAGHELPARTVVRPLGARVLRIDDGGVALDGVLLLPPDAVAQVALLRWLAERWREDIAAGKVPADHCVWSADEIASELGAVGGAMKPDTVRRQLSRLRAALRERFVAATGVQLAEDAVVELVGGAARLNPSVLVRGA